MWREQIGDTSDSREKTLYGSLHLRMPNLYISTIEERNRLGMTFDQYVEQCVDKDTLRKEMYKGEYNGTSLFDPALAELMYHWFTPSSNSRVFDCFAGDITKGYVAEKLGHEFTGIEIRTEQVEINNARLEDLDVSPKYIADDGKNVNMHLGFATQDLLITCPPYYNLEKYSDYDSSAAPDYTTFIKEVGDVLSASIDCLKKNRFAVIIVSDVRADNGEYYGFPEDVINVFRNKGCILWNDIIYINADSHAHLRAGVYMNTRKVVRMHQRVLVFYNGNPNSIRKHFPKLTQNVIK